MAGLGKTVQLRNLLSWPETEQAPRVRLRADARGSHGNYAAAAVAVVGSGSSFGSAERGPGTFTMMRAAL